MERHVAELPDVLGVVGERHVAPVELRLLFVERLGYSVGKRVRQVRTRVDDSAVARDGGDAARDTAEQGNRGLVLREVEVPGELRAQIRRQLEVPEVVLLRRVV